MQGHGYWETWFLGVRLWRLATKATRFLFPVNFLFLEGFFFFLQPSVLAAVSSLLSENISYKFNIFVVSFCIDFHFFFLSLSPSPHPQHPTGQMLSSRIWRSFIIHSERGSRKLNGILGIIGVACQIIAFTLQECGRETVILTVGILNTIFQSFLFFSQGFSVSPKKDFPVLCLGRICLAVSILEAERWEGAGCPKVIMESPSVSSFQGSVSSLSCLKTLDLVLPGNNLAPSTIEGGESPGISCWEDLGDHCPLYRLSRQLAVLFSVLPPLPISVAGAFNF